MHQLAWKLRTRSRWSRRERRRLTSKPRQHWTLSNGYPQELGSHAGQTDMSMARGEVQGPALHWMGHHGAQQRNRKEAVSQTPGTLPPDGCHHRRQLKRHGSFWTSPSCSGTLGRPTVQVEDPTPRLGQVFAVGYHIPCGSKLERVTFPETPPPHPLSLLEGFRPCQQSQRGESKFPSSLSSESREPGPLGQHGPEQLSLLPLAVCWPTPAIFSRHFQRRPGTKVHEVTCTFSSIEVSE